MTLARKPRPRWGKGTGAFATQGFGSLDKQSKGVKKKKKAGEGIRAVGTPSEASQLSIVGSSGGVPGPDASEASD